MNQVYDLLLKILQNCDEKVGKIDIISKHKTNSKDSTNFVYHSYTVGMDYQMKQIAVDGIIIKLQAWVCSSITSLVPWLPYLLWSTISPQNET